MAQANPERFHSQCWACARPSMSENIDWDAPCPWGPWDEICRKSCCRVTGRSDCVLSTVCCMAGLDSRGLFMWS
eukprot:4482970-Prymnesium_polylepis.1